MGSWKKILLDGDVAFTFDDVNAPQPADMDPAYEGVSTDAAHSDHIHGLGPLEDDLPFAKQQALSLVIQGTAPDPAAEVEGEVYFDTDHLKVWITV
jgi:hypothetical protein